MGYRGKVAEQNRACELRSAGWTLTEIAAELGVAKSSVSLWVRDVEIDEVILAARRRERWLTGNEGARRRGPNKLQRAKQEQIERLRGEGRARIGELSEREFLVAGVALYAGEGGKTHGLVSFPNSDPRMLLFFATWLRRFFAVDETRLRVRLYLHDGLDLEAAFEFWSALLDVPRDQFGKPYRAVADPTIRKAKHPLGCPRLDYSGTRTHRAVLGLVDGLLTCESSIPG